MRPHAQRRRPPETAPRTSTRCSPKNTPAPHTHRQQIRAADEGSRELALGRPVQLARRPALLEPGPVHDGDPVGQSERLDLVMGDVEDRHLGQLAVQPGEFGEHPGPQPRVERREGFVEKKHPGRMANARAMATRCCCPPDNSVDGAGRTPHADHLQRLGDPGTDLPRGTFCALSPKATLSSTRRCGKSAYCWTTMPTPRRYGGRSVTSRPRGTPAPTPAVRTPRPPATPWSCRSRTVRAGP